MLHDTVHDLFVVLERTIHVNRSDAKPDAGSQAKCILFIIYLFVFFVESINDIIMLKAFENRKILFLVLRDNCYAIFHKLFLLHQFPHQQISWHFPYFASICIPSLKLIREQIYGTGSTDTHM